MGITTAHRGDMEEGEVVDIERFAYEFEQTTIDVVSDGTKAFLRIRGNRNIWNPSSIHAVREAMTRLFTEDHETVIVDLEDVKNIHSGTFEMLREPTDMEAVMEKALAKYQAEQKKKRRGKSKKKTGKSTRGKKKIVSQEDRERAMEYLPWHEEKEVVLYNPTPEIQRLIWFKMFCTLGEKPGQWILHKDPQVEYFALQGLSAEPDFREELAASQIALQKLASETPYTMTESASA
jgi:hypothetical protein